VGLLSRFVANEDGATAIEYALIAGGIALVVVAVVALLGENVRANYELVAPGFEPRD
jgi:pilus assembly protein Flp/PilA